MLAITIELDPVNLAEHFGGIEEDAHDEISDHLLGFGFNRAQIGLYLSDDNDMANLFRAIMVLKSLPWLSSSVRGVRAFRVEDWSDFTSTVKGEPRSFSVVFGGITNP